MAGGLVTSISAFLSARTNGRKVNVSPDDPLPVTVVSGGGGSATSLADSSVVDSANPPVYWLVRDDGTTLTYTNWATGLSGSPTAPVMPVGAGAGRRDATQNYTVVTAGTGYAVGDVLQRITILNILTTPPSVVAATWVNVTQGTVLASAPSLANLNAIDDNVTAAVTGNVASGAADSGNPVKIGGVAYGNTAAIPVYTAGQRAQVSMGTSGNQIVSIGLSATGGVTGVDASAMVRGVGTNIDGGATNNSSGTLAVFGYSAVFNGTTWDRQRGDTNGAWVGGNVASGAADAGNPVKIGGYASDTAPAAVTNGQRVNAWFSVNGALMIGGANSSGADNTSNSNLRSVLAQGFGSGGGQLLVAPCIFNGVTWDRAKKPNATSRIASSANTTNATVAKASAGDLFAIQGYNTTASVVYLKLYNKASTPTVGTDTPVKTIAIPPNAPIPPNCMWANGLYFSTGIAYALTGAAADNDTTVVSAGAIVGLNLDYV